MTYGLKFNNGNDELVLDDSSVKPWYVKDPTGTIPYGLNYKNIDITSQYDFSQFGTPKNNGATETWLVFALYYLAPNNCVSVGTYTLPSSDTTGIWYATAGSEPLYYLSNSKTPGPMVIPSYLGGETEYISSVGGTYPFFIIHAMIPASWLSTATTAQINAAIPKVYFFGITAIPNADLSTSYLTAANTYGVRLYNQTAACTYDSSKSHVKIDTYSFPSIQTLPPPGSNGPDYNGSTTINNFLGMPATPDTAAFQIPNIVQKSLVTTNSGNNQSINVYKTFFKRTVNTKLTSVTFSVAAISNVIGPTLPDGTVYFNQGSELLYSIFDFGLPAVYASRLLIVDSAYLDLGYTPVGLPASYSLAVYSGDGTGIAYELIDPYYGTSANNRIEFILNTSGLPNGTLVNYTLSGIAASDMTDVFRYESGVPISITPSLSGYFYIYNGLGTVNIYIADNNVVNGNKTVTMTLSNGKGTVSMLIKEKQSFKLSYTADKLPKTQYSDDYQEGTTVTVTLKSANIPNGTVLPYTISGTNITSSDINNASLTGNFTVNTGGGTTSHGTATLTIVLTNDNIAEGTETLLITVGTTATYYLPINTASFRIIDPVLSYTILGPSGETSGPITVTEGNTYTFTVQTTAVPNGTLVYPRFDAPNTAVWADLTASWFNKTTSTYTGITINNNVGTFSFTVLADYITEGTEYFNVYLDNAPAGTQVASWGQVNITDTTTDKNEILSISPTSVVYPSATTVYISGGVPNSKVYYHTDVVATTSDPFVTLDASGNYTNTNAAPSISVGTHTLYLLFEPTSHTRSASWTVTAPTPTYTIAANVSSVNEGGSVTYTVTTTNVADGTTLYYRNLGTTTGADVTSGATVGPITIYSGTGSITRTFVNDNLTEGSETDYLFLYTDGLLTNWTGAYTAQVVVNDTSLTPVVPTYSFGIIPSSINEGSSGTFNVSTQNVANGTTLYWSVQSNLSDFGTTASSFTISSGSGSFVVSPTADNLTEGAETFTVAVRTGSTGGTIVATSNSVTINDTSLTPAPVYNETITGTTTAVYPNGVNITWAGGVPNDTVYYEVNNSNVTTSSASFTLLSNGSANNPTAGANLPVGAYTVYCLYNSTGHTRNFSFTITANNPAAGTYLGQYCTGIGTTYTLMYTYANGSGGSYDQVYQNNSTTCGYSAPAGLSVTGYSLNTSGMSSGSYTATASPNASYDSINIVGNSVDSSTNSVSRTFTTNVACTITYYLNMSSEANYDFGFFSIDGVQRLTGSGTYASGANTLALAAGSHTVLIRYTKDGSVSVGSDNAFAQWSLA